MAGIYIHIPYCRQACRYCDFHFNVSVWQKKELIPYLLQEIEERKDYIENEVIDTIYFGGGTPSVLDKGDIENILKSIYKFHTVSSMVEISFEANPEDLKKDYLNKIIKTGINRLSIGIQSFQDGDLELMHRIHNSKQAIQAVWDARQEGFENVSIDLIYGLPRQEKESWEKNLEIAFSLGVQHISAYHLTYEPGTIFDHWRKKGRINPITEEESLKQFKTLINKASEHTFEHYEISNFALEGYQSNHNKSYWEQKIYIGIGPSAHSYDLISRRWNFSNNKKYMEGMHSGSEYYESELLTADNRYNEFIMTSLRTAKGVNYLKLEEQFGKEKAQFFKTKIQKFIDSGHIKIEQELYKLSDKGIFIADHVIVAVFA